MAGMEYSESDGLLIGYDEETGTFTFTWDEETHSQWNCLLGLTSEKFSQLLENYLDYLETNHCDTKVQAGGPCSGTPEGNCNPEPEP